MDSYELMCGDLYDRRRAGVEADVPNLTAVERRFLTAATEFCLNVRLCTISLWMYAVVLDLMMPNASQVLFKIVLSKFLPWSDWRISGMPKREKMSTSTHTILSAVWSGIGIASAHFVK